MRIEDPSKNYEKFKLFQFLRADLLRATALNSGTLGHKDVGLRLWSGILSPRFIPILLCRLAYFFYNLNFVVIAKFFSLLNFFFFGIEIALQCHIGKGIYFPHTQGTVIGAYMIGRNVTVYQGVTIGAVELDFSFKKVSRPYIGNNVTIGAGAKVLGGICIDDGIKVGANAVVLKSFSKNVTVVGIPAKALSATLIDEV